MKSIDKFWLAFAAPFLVVIGILFGSWLLGALYGLISNVVNSKNDDSNN